MSKQSGMHIPGPWTCQPIGDETECNILWPRRELIATVSDNEARLIAAAPDLLKALKEARRDLFEALGGHDDEQNEMNANSVCNYIDAAIAKATA